MILSTITPNQTHGLLPSIRLGNGVLTVYSGTFSLHTFICLLSRLFLSPSRITRDKFAFISVFPLPQFLFTNLYALHPHISTRSTRIPSLPCFRRLPRRSGETILRPISWARALPHTRKDPYQTLDRLSLHSPVLLLSVWR